MTTTMSRTDRSTELASSLASLLAEQLLGDRTANEFAVERLYQNFTAVEVISASALFIRSALFELGIDRSSKRQLGRFLRSVAAIDLATPLGDARCQALIDILAGPLTFIAPYCPGGDLVGFADGFVLLASAISAILLERLGRGIEDLGALLATSWLPYGDPLAVPTLSALDLEIRFADLTAFSIVTDGSLFAGTAIAA
jgi:hypothetical protein